MTSLTDPLGALTATNTYDSLGRVMTQTVPRQGGATAAYDFFFSGYRNQEVDPNGHAITYFYDEQGREYAQENPLGHKTAREFDGQDHVISTDGPRTDVTDVTEYHYDGQHNITSVVNAQGQTTTHTYDTQHRLIGTNSPLTQNTRYAYDSQHHLTGSHDAVGNTTGASYFSNGLKRTATDGRGAVTALAYDAYGNPLTSAVAGRPPVTYAYDAIGRMTGLTDQAGSSTVFVYDRRDLILSKTDPLGRTTSFSYDNAGRLANKTDRKNSTISYTYTPTGKPDTITYPNQTTVHFTYNNLDNLTSIQEPAGTTSFTLYDAANRLKSVTNPHGFTLSYDYDEAGNITRIAYPGGKIVDYQYDSLNRLWKVLFNGLTATYHYDAASGRLTGLTQFNGATVSYGYDAAYRLTSLENQDGGTLLAGYQFTLDGNGNRIRTVQSEPLAPSTPPQNAAYTYNPQKNRLLSAGTNSFTYDNEGQLASGYSADYAFDYEHRLTGIDTASQFVYDSRGNRLQATRDGTVTRYIYDMAGNLLAEADGSNNITHYYIHGQGLLAMATPADQLYCYHYNATGSTVAITDSSRAVVNKYAYDSFGNITGQEEAQGLSHPFKYVGQYGVMAEPNGFYYMRARYYDPQVGRFVSEDPTGFDGGDVNLYAYVGGNPVNGIDPSGLEIWVVNRPVRGVLESIGANHAFLWDTTTNTGYGMGGSSGSGMIGMEYTFPPPGSYRVVPNSDGREAEVIAYMVETGNQGLWIPFLNDCHTKVDDVLSHFNLENPGAPGGRLGQISYTNAGKKNKP
jgi:RHS repeat-associated protein